jgi:hypothetical protein
MSERQGIEIDYCPKCRGVWLDRGELDKIIERSGASQPEMQKTPQVRHGHDDDHDKSHQGHYKRKKSFFEEIFD